eukprot:CAMPEP_0206237934 /NCGR_PEP_ID=MMETSP0047_2-20121206/14538_1 /ASSEMBLY_ACC=CAM_ASM_000192 /TAXON_ID=195065 /ORGANISM="Chroomonas mesostigmatica_cf, Strain CCMP1168" /LENGTH=367 /DNA_ID=CAMNT_0053662419 /DNA_START=79 /DNA_END=1178 /DNA_ORIENTATION=-
MSTTGASKKISPSDLPPILLQKMQMHWTKATRAFMNMDKDRSGRISSKEFQKVCAGIGCDLTDKDMVKVMAIFDKNGDGEVDNNEFVKVVGDLLFPPAYSDGLSLNFTPNFRSKRPEGRSKHFKGLNADWNNPYHQSLDAEGTGKPVLESIIQGRYYQARTDPYDRPESSLSTHKGFKGTQMDTTLQQPMVKSLIQGEFYGNPPRTAGGGRKDRIDFVTHNKRMTREYSKLVAGTRPQSGRAMRDSVTRGECSSAGPFQTIAARPTRMVRTKLAQNLDTPRDAGELQELWGRALDPKFVATTLSWLSKASDQEKRQFKQAVCAFPVQISARPALGRSVTPRTGFGAGRLSRPQSATGVRYSRAVAPA